MLGFRIVWIAALVVVLRVDELVHERASFLRVQQGLVDDDEAGGLVVEAA